MPGQTGTMERIALRKLGNPENFQFYEWRMVDREIAKLTGCVVTRTYSKGPRKGEPKYDGAPQVAYVAKVEVLAEEARYERETGKCAACEGEAREVWRVSVVDGTTYRPCSRCKGTGKAAPLEPQGEKAKGQP